MHTGMQAVLPHGSTLNTGQKFPLVVSSPERYATLGVACIDTVVRVDKSETGRSLAETLQHHYPPSSVSTLSSYPNYRLDLLITLV